MKKWTLHTVEVLENKAGKVARQISESVDSVHSDWYADFKNNKSHYIIFRNKVFKVDRSKKGQYDKVVKYGLSLGIPDYHLNFSPDIKEWER